MKLPKLIILCLLTTISIAPAFAQTHHVPLYSQKMLRLAEIMGSLHYLRNLCGEEGTQWRDRMNTLIETEKPDAERKARLYAAFNDAYRAFSESYRQCTPAAIEAITRYTEEGVTLSEDLVNRYGN